MREAFGRGELSYSKVRALTRVEDVEDELTLLELARDATAAQLERIVRGYRGVLRAEQAETAQRERRVSLHQDPDGSWVLHGRLPAEDGALLAKALEAARDELRKSARENPPAPWSAPAGPNDPAVNDVSAETPDDPHGASMADALVLIADSMLATGPVERTAGDRYQVVVHVDTATLTAKPRPASKATGVGDVPAETRATAGGVFAETPAIGDGVSAETPGPRCELDTGAPIAGETARRLACDASIVEMRERDGEPLSVGRKTRSIPPALRRALKRRDRCCQFPGCNQRRSLDAHHITHWANGGHTALDNLTHLCRYHHRLLHEGGYKLNRRGHRLEFHTPTGQLLPPVPTPRPGDYTAIRSPKAQIHPGTCGSRCNGERYDHPTAVDIILTAAPTNHNPPPRLRGNANPERHRGNAPPHTLTNTEPALTASF